MFEAGDFDCWYKQPIVRRIRGEVASSEPFIIQSNNFDCAFFLKKYADTTNLVPLPNYDTNRLSSLKDLLSLQTALGNTADGFTTGLIPLQLRLSSEQIEQIKATKEFIFRNDSFELDLSNSVSALISKVSKRKRPKITGPSFNKLNFNKNHPEAKDSFYRNYEFSNSILGIADEQIYSFSQINELIELDSTHLFSMYLDGKPALTHLVGLNSNRSRAEFVYSVFASDEARQYALQLIWFTAMSLKGIGVSAYHLGGGVKQKDGLENFKRQIGGDRLINVCKVVINDRTKYQHAARTNTCLVDPNSRFPPYL